MKIKIICAAVLLGGVGQLWADTFTPGNLIIYRVGTGSGSLVNTGNPIFLDEYTTNGTLVQSIALPTTASGANYPIAASGTAVSEGLLSLSADGQYIFLTGYGTNSYSSSLASSSGSAVPRVVARVDLNGNIDTTTALTDFASGNNPRSVASSNGTNIWVAGGAGGVRYTTLGSSTSVQVTGTGSTTNNIRQLEIFNNQLYFSAQSGALRLATPGFGLPTTSGNVSTNLPGFPTSGSPNAFVMLDLNPSINGVDTLYLADEGGAGGIYKYSLVGGNWTSNGVVTASAVRGITASVGIVGSITNVYLFGTTGGGAAAGGGALYGFDDVTGYNGALAGSAMTLATAGANTAFRGIAYLPIVVVPEPSTVLLVIAGIGAMLVIRRRR